ncbi:hypothetical protein SLEP1_g37234 [Rubroshorea leprosula]|uniref:RNase H type-1 domain-containing protein n=1 Tax=Rubroshorea leprosula TaxID=152421 RepID=A0AAV5KUM8_9ROSI|nr:hypothetical protein SLEP1_g37234 [Rubroshorea leprosula]
MNYSSPSSSWSEPHGGGTTAGGLHNGRWLHGFSVNVGITSSFIAELWGCREGLKLAHSLGISHLMLEMDSLLAVQLIHCRQLSVGPASILLNDIHLLLDHFHSCAILHTLGEGNKAANYMASIGHGSPLGIRYFPTPPASINLILLGDSAGTMFLRD